MADWKKIGILGAGIATTLLGFGAIALNKRAEQPASQTLETKVANGPSETQEKDYTVIVYTPETTGQSVTQTYKVHKANQPLRGNFIAMVERDKLAMGELQQNGHDKLDAYLMAQIDAFIENPEYEHDPGILSRTEILEARDNYHRKGLRLHYKPKQPLLTVDQRTEVAQERARKTADEHWELSRERFRMAQMEAEAELQRKRQLDRQWQAMQACYRQ